MISTRLRLLRRYAQKPKLTTAAVAQALALEQDSPPEKAELAAVIVSATKMGDRDQLKVALAAYSAADEAAPEVAPPAPDREPEPEPEPIETEQPDVAVEIGLSSMLIKGACEIVEAAATTEELDQLEAEEKAGKERVSVLRAITKRREALREESDQ